MRTFNEFMLIAEDYYRPNEKLPSGKTPLEKAKAKGITGEKLAKVKRGADNRSIDTTSHDDLEIIKHPTKKGHVAINHKPTGINFTLKKWPTKTKHGKDVHSFVWTHGKEGQMLSDKEARQTVRDANTVFKQHISHRFPHGSVVHNNPLPSYKKTEYDYETTNPRARIYKRWGFGNPHGNPDMPDQFASAGRNPSPRQKAKGKIRLKPLENKDD
jgi:hypothetical protein